MIRPLRKALAGWLLREPPASGSDLLHSPQQMQMFLDRERMRSDRGNSSFSLLRFTFAGPMRGDTLDRMAGVFRQRLRATDDAGLLSADSVGILLPETNAVGAWTVAADLERLLPLLRDEAECDVFTYPGENGPFDDDRVEAAREPDFVSHQAHQAPSGGVAIERPPRQVRPMQALFLKPLPAWKRALDIVGAATALILLSPLLIAVAVVIKITSPGPVIFRQLRHTLGGRPFMMYKFRTMTADAEQQKAALRPLSEQDGPAFKIADDPRVTRLGRFLRSTSIDELPQLVNVLKGEITLVGPRPLPCDESHGCERWQQRRLDVTPGLTCIWQVRGRSSVSFAEWMRMDLQYIQSRTAAHDLKLLVATVPAVVIGRGAR